MEAWVTWLQVVYLQDLLKQDHKIDNNLLKHNNNRYNLWLLIKAYSKIAHSTSLN